MQNLSGDMATYAAQSLYRLYVGTGTTVANTFASNPGIQLLAYYQSTDAQNPNSSQGLKIFANPSAVCTDSVQPTSQCQISNQSDLSHEGLHEFYDLDDATLQRIFKIAVLSDCTADISDYIAFTLFNTPLQECEE
jgi:hypothetical protein